MQTNSPNTVPDLIIYGGAFDPPHLGHLGCVKAALQRFPNASLWIVPGAAPAGIQLTHKQTQATYEQRVAMCGLNFAESISSGRATISHIEADLPKPNYTVQTLRALREQFPKKKLGFMVGSDQLRNFHLWHHPELILEMASMIVVQRQGEEVKTVDLSEFGAAHVVLIDTAVPDAASSKIRELIAARKPIPDGWLSPQITAFIKQHKLYTE